MSKLNYIFCKYNCILCKYRKDKDKCMNAITDGNFKCPSLSNIFYGKIIELPIIKQIYNLCDYIRRRYPNKKLKNEYISEYETTNAKFIWGRKAWDDLTRFASANLFTMNDIDLIYLKNDNKYKISIETALIFEEEQYKMRYLQTCLKDFTKFMDENGYNTDVKPDWADVFSYGWNLNTEFDSIEDCYAMFKLLVNGYCCEE